MRPRRPGAVATPAWLLGIALTLAGCSPTGSTAAPGSGSSSTTTGTPRGDTVVTDRDNGSQVSLRPGQRLSVDLGADFGPVTVSDRDVVETVAVDGGYPTGQRLAVVLRAGDPGEASLSSETDFECLHESIPCSVPQQEWTLMVTVAAG